jgi:hypothetical protein
MTRRILTEMIQIYNLKRKLATKEELAQAKKLIRKAIFQIRVAEIMKQNKYSKVA